MKNDYFMAKNRDVYAHSKVSDRYKHSHTHTHKRTYRLSSTLWLTLVLTLEKFVAHLLLAYLDAQKGRQTKTADEAGHGEERRRRRHSFTTNCKYTHTHIRTHTLMCDSQLWLSWNVSYRYKLLAAEQLPDFCIPLCGRCQFNSFWLHFICSFFWSLLALLVIRCQRCLNHFWLMQMLQQLNVYYVMLNNTKL